MKNKKGVSQALWIAIVVIPLLILLGILLWNMFKGQIAFGTKYNQWEMQANIRSCSAQAELAKGADFLDRDFGDYGDGYPDSCDVCLGGDDSKDADLDGIPDACDNDPRNAPEKGTTMKEICENQNGAYWDEKRGRCVLPKYPAALRAGTT